MGALCILASMLAAAPSLNKAISLYNNLDDAAAAKELRALLGKHDLADSVASRAHLYLGLIALNAINSKEARDEFEEALKLDPMIELPRRASPKSKLAFSEARHDLQIEMAKPVQPARRATAPPSTSPGSPPAAAPGALPNLELSPDQSLNPQPSPPPEAAQAPVSEAVPAPQPAAAAPPPPMPPPPRGPIMLIPPPAPPPADTLIVDEHAKEEPPPAKNYAVSITLGALTLVAGGFAITGAVEVNRYNATLTDARNNPGKYSGGTIAARENTAQIWEISAIALAVLSAVGVTTTVLTW
jgi:hypothetical protein